MPTKPALATRPTCAGASANSRVIGATRKPMSRTSIASNIHPRPLVMSSFQ
jgi:hypothetical protein